MSTKQLSTSEFVSRCQAIYKDAYQYNDTQYKNLRSDVTVTCTIHGNFTKNARAILNGAGCPTCNTNWNSYVTRRRMTTDQFVQKAVDLHEGFYSYTKTQYVNSRTKIVITCPVHGDFLQGAGGHLEGYGCPKCGDKKHGDYRPWFIETYFKRFPEKINLPATLYLLYSDEEAFYKVGITTKQSVTDRIKYMAHYPFKIVDFVNDTMYNVSIAEQKILSENERYKPTKRFGGYSECLKGYVDINKYLPEQGR